MANKQNAYLVPGSIIVAGLLIAGAVLYINGPSSGGGVNLGGAPEEAGSLDPVEIAQDIGLNKRNFEKCVEEGRYSQDVSDDLAQAQKVGGTGTPYFVIVGEGLDGVVAVSGAQPINNFEAALEMVRGDSELVSIEEGLGYGYIAEISDGAMDGDHIRGDANAPIKIIEYSDYECPFCSRVHPTIQSLLSTNSDVAWIYRHLPLEQIHPMARPLAEASECAAELGGNDAFWAFTDALLGS